MLWTRRHDNGDRPAIEQRQQRGEGAAPATCCTDHVHPQGGRRQIARRKKLACRRRVRNRGLRHRKRRRKSARSSATNWPASPKFWLWGRGPHAMPPGTSLETKPLSRMRAAARCSGGSKIAEDDLMNAGGAFDLEQVPHANAWRVAAGRRQAQSRTGSTSGRARDQAIAGVIRRCNSMPTGRSLLASSRSKRRFPTKNPWMVLNFLARPDARLDGKRPIDLLRAGGVDVVVEAASRYGEQGA